MSKGLVPTRHNTHQRLHRAEMYKQLNGPMQIREFFTIKSAQIHPFLSLEKPVKIKLLTRAVKAIINKDPNSKLNSAELLFLFEQSDDLSHSRHT
jgi:hypothetical protein